MSDYTKTTNFTAKDALATGDPLKIIKGSYFDTEFDAIAVANATKFDSNNFASQAQAEALTVDTVIITPHTLNDVLVDNGGMLANIQALADPGADTILGWDNSATDVISFTIGAGLSHAGTEINVADAMAGAGLTVTSSIFAVGAGNGLTVNANDVALTDVVAGAAQPFVVTSGTVTFDLSSITEITGPNLSQSADGFVMSDAGVIKVMPYDQAALTVLTADAAQTFAITDANTINVLTGTTERIWTIPANAAVAFEIGSVMILQNSGTADIVVLADTGVILDSINHTAAATAQSDHVVPGGTAALIKTASDTWALAGDIEDT